MFLARDFITTSEGLIFAVTLNGTENGRVIACLRYVPGPQGISKVDTRQATALLRTDYSHYLYHSPHRDVTLSAVPVERIERHWCPRKRLADLLNTLAAESIITRLQRLVDLLIGEGIDSENLGVTGSILACTQSENSDIDLVLYGRKTFEQGRLAIQRLISRGHLHPPTEALWRSTYQRRGCALTFSDYLWHEQRKYHKGAIDSSKFDLILVEKDRRDNDHRHWTKRGHHIIRSTVIDASGAFSTPARYGLDHPDVPVALSYTATYVGQAEAGERVEISGHLEQATDGTRRMIVGSSREAPGEYIKVIH